VFRKTLTRAHPTVPSSTILWISPLLAHQSWCWWHWGPWYCQRSTPKNALSPYSVGSTCTYEQASPPLPAILRICSNPLETPRTDLTAYVSLDLLLLFGEFRVDLLDVLVSGQLVHLVVDSLGAQNTGTQRTTKLRVWKEQGVNLPSPLRIIIHKPNNWSADGGLLHTQQNT